MSFFRKLFNQNNTPPPSYNPEESIQVFDEYGREIEITKKAWVSNVLHPNIQENWNSSEGLYRQIIGALNDNFDSEILKAAKHYYSIESNKEQGACLYAIVLMKNHDTDKAEKILLDYINTYGESGSALTNLAKVYTDKNDINKADEILWRAIEVDPNQDNGLDWYLVLCNERGGTKAYHEALERVSTLPGAWRPFLHLAKEALDTKNKESALSYYSQLCDINKDINALTLQQISGDLGIAGYIPEILSIAYPLFSAEKHGFEAGNNFIRAFIELQQFSEAQALVDQLFSFNRPD